MFEQGQRVRLPGVDVPQGWLTVAFAQPSGDGHWTLFVRDDGDTLHQVVLDPTLATAAEVLTEDGRAPSTRMLAGMWTQWMTAAATNARSTLLASSPLRPYAHQANAVYGAMLPQPWLRFLLADEPGTGKTIMAGLYLREMQRYGLIRKALVVAPANLVTKWQSDFERFFGGGLRRITSSTVREHALDVDHDMWVVSLELAAVNGAVQDAIRPDKAGWDVVVFDEAHRLTPTAVTFHRVGRLLARRTPRALLMTATPHRGSEWLFRHLLHLVDPDIYPDPGEDPKAELAALRPGSIHFLRRMKEDLVDYDGVTRLFKGRRAANHRVPLNRPEFGIYRQAVDMVEQFFVPAARPLARRVYGKRAASSLHALVETLRRRLDCMGKKAAAEAAAEADPFGDDESSRDEATVINADSTSTRTERKYLHDLLDQIARVLGDRSYVPSKWRVLTEDCLGAHSVLPHNREQAVVFTEHADTAEWLTQRLADAGYSARMYSGRQPHHERDRVQAAFMHGEFQIIVTTDAGNEGIDLQSAAVLVNYDIPWSLVRLEQRMGRIHRVGQDRSVELFNLVAVETDEGDVLHALLEKFVTAANELDGQMFDSLSLVAELTGIQYEEWLQAFTGNDETKKHEALEAVRRVSAAELKRIAQRSRDQEAEFASKVDAVAALTLLQADMLDRINPAIVEAYLRRLENTGMLQARPTAAGDGILELRASNPFPPGLGGTTTTLVATSGDALRSQGANVDTSRALPLGPGDHAFAELIQLAAAELASDIYRGGAAEDPTSITGYDLYAYQATLAEAGGSRSTAWASLIRVDETGQAFPIRWETLANLTPVERAAPAFHPAHDTLADNSARELAESTRSRQQKVREEWFASARRELLNLPISLTETIADRDDRIRLRDHLAAKTEHRLSHLQKLSSVDISQPRRVARLHVYPAAAPVLVEEKDSEEIAMRHVMRLLRGEGWRVSDVHGENCGYDLYAVREREQRFVEIKGVWTSASSNGIELTGNEVLIATQHAKTYWLYVVDNCQNGTGELFGTFRDPISLFASDIKGDAIFRVPGSSLKNARDREWNS